MLILSQSVETVEPLVLRQLFLKPFHVSDLQIDNKTTDPHLITFFSQGPLLEDIVYNVIPVYAVGGEITVERQKSFFMECANFY